ncbi:MAG TPA: proton-conducting transporter membrane subunit [Steroidobacteraceae bacterium]|nr:proton-conducting transporter membrane subunit [Steroidobacteraceae bacterium]
MSAATSLPLAGLLPLVVLLPLGIAAALLAVSHWLPARFIELSALATSLSVAAACARLAQAGLTGPIVQWMGGWAPAASGRSGVVLGVSFAADPTSAALAAFAALLFALAFVFAWGEFDDTHGHFHVLMLLFLAALAGFCLTQDLFNLFVWFELMSVAAFALTAYPLGKSSLEGALNFTITNALGSFLMLAGIGLLYARTGTLDMATMGRMVMHLSGDPVVAAGFCMIAAALLTKGAIVPFHLWLSDAHTVAPAAVSVTFSGAMVSVALFGLAKLLAKVFLGNAQLAHLSQEFLAPLGIATAILGALMTWAQRHLKRLLAFSTISHMGVVVLAIATLRPAGLAGLLVYIIGHGLVKGALFMLAGMLLALRASGDEIILYRRGRGLGMAAPAMLLAALLFCNVPWGLLHRGEDLIAAADADATTRLVLSLATALTGAAILRAALRIFFGCSGVPGVERAAPSEPEHEKAQRPLWVMQLSCWILLGLAVLPGGSLVAFARAAAQQLLPGTLSAAALSGESSSIAALLFVVAVLAAALLRVRPVRPLMRAVARGEGRLFGALQGLHSGLVGDYVVWMLLGLAALIVCAQLLG